MASTGGEHRSDGNTGMAHFQPHKRQKGLLSCEQRKPEKSCTVTGTGGPADEEHRQCGREHRPGDSRFSKAQVK